MTVAGTVCDIESNSSTEIVCVTNSHKPAIETRVNVDTEHGNMYPVRLYYFIMIFRCILLHCGKHSRLTVLSSKSLEVQFISISLLF